MSRALPYQAIAEERSSSQAFFAWKRPVCSRPKEYRAPSDGLHHAHEAALARRVDIAEREALDRAALARIGAAMLPLKFDRAGRRLDEALAFRRARGDHAPHLPINPTHFAEAEREKDHADIAYRALVEQATGQKWTDVARRLAA